MRSAVTAVCAVLAIIVMGLGCGGTTDDTGVVLTPAEMAGGTAEAATVYWWAALVAEPATGASAAGASSRQVTEDWAEAWLTIAYEGAFGGTVAVDVTSLTSSALSYSVTLAGGSAAGGQLAISGSLSVNATYTLTPDLDALEVGSANITFTSLVVGMTTITGTLSAQKASGSDDLQITCDLTATRGTRTVSFQGNGTGSGGDTMTYFTGSFVAVTINNSHRTFNATVAQLSMLDGAPYPTGGALTFGETGAQYTVSFAASGETSTAPMAGPVGGTSDVELPPLG